MYDFIIPIGQTCNISFLMQNLKIKKCTTLFEWFISNNLKYITDVLYKIENNTDNNIVKQINNHICLIDDNIKTQHYKYEEFIDIYI